MRKKKTVTEKQFRRKRKLFCRKVIQQKKKTILQKKLFSAEHIFSRKTGNHCLIKSLLNQKNKFGKGKKKLSFAEESYSAEIGN